MTETNVNTIGISKTYNIIIAQCEPLTWSGPEEQLWPYVTEQLNGAIQRGDAPEGTIPDVQPVAEPEQPEQPAIQVSAPEQPEQQQRTGDGESDEQRLARVEEDRTKLESLGFSLGQVFHDRGVAGEGSNGQVRRSATEHEDKPRVPEAVEVFCEAIKREERRDILSPTTGLVMRADGSIVGKDGERWSIEQDAMKQLASRCGIEQPGYLATVWPELRAQNWNQHLATAIGHDNSTCAPDHPVRKRLEPVGSRDTMCRVRKDAQGNPTLWAALSERYASYDVDRIARALQEGMSAYPEARCEIQYNGFRAQMDVMFHTDVEPARYSAGEVFKMGIRVRSSDAGGGSITVGLSAWQSLCTNMMMVDVGQFKLAQLRHIGSSDRLAEKFAESMQKAQAQIAPFLERWGYACEESLATVAGADFKPDHLRLLDEMESETVTETDLLTGIFKGIGKTGAVSLGRNDLPGLLAAHARDESGAVQFAPVTRASVVNAITRHAHEHVGRINPMRQQELEREAGALLVSGRGGNPTALPFMPPRQRATA